MGRRQAADRWRLRLRVPFQSTKPKEWPLSRFAQREKRPFLLASSKILLQLLLFLFLLLFCVTLGQRRRWRMLEAVRGNKAPWARGAALPHDKLYQNSLAPA